MDKKVLHLRSSNGFLGAENVIIELCKYSKGFGYQAIIGAIKDKKESYPEFIVFADKLGIDTVIFNCTGRIDYSCLKDIRNFIYLNKVHMLHSHGYKEDFYSIFLSNKVAKIATNHLWKKTTISTKIYFVIDAFILRFFDMVVGVSEDIVSEMKLYGIKDAISIPNGIDIDKFVIRKKSMTILDRFGLTTNSIILGMISSLTPEKGHEIAIYSLSKVIQKFPKIKLIIVGDGNYKSYLQSLVIKLGLQEFVIFSGKQSIISEILSIIDIFLITSLKEGMPMALLEAMASGKAVIATRVGDIAKVIKDKESGLLIPPSNNIALEEAILELLSDTVDIVEMGKKARQTIVKYYSSKQMTNKYCGLYETINLLVK